MSDLGNREIMAANIKKYLEHKGLTMKDLSVAIDVPYTTVCAWCKAEIYPRIDKIEKLAKFFNCTKADLVEREIDINSKERMDKIIALDKAFNERPEMRMLFDALEGASAEDIKQAVKIIEALKK